MKSSEILKQARDVIKHRGWTKGEFARTEHGNIVSQHSPDAAQFCVIGAISHVQRFIPYEEFLKLSYYHYPSAYLQKAIGGEKAGNLETWNDKWYRMKWQVLRAFNKAIELAEKDGN